MLQKIVGFRHEDLPVSLGILIDSSGSMYDKRPAVDAAALNLVKLSNPKDEAFLVDFNSEAYIDQDFTSSILKLQQGLAYVKAGGGTALYDAVIASADYLSKNAKQPKQVLLIITDGDDNCVERDAGGGDPAGAGLWMGRRFIASGCCSATTESQGFASTRGRCWRSYPKRRVGRLIFPRR